MTLDDLEKICNAATPGPWIEVEGELVQSGTEADEYPNVVPLNCADVDFVLAARTAMPVLIAKVRELQTVLKGAEWGGPSITCPSCCGFKEHDEDSFLGHNPDCDVYHALKPITFGPNLKDFDNVPF